MTEIGSQQSNDANARAPNLPTLAGTLVCLEVLSAVFYNAILAFLNARGLAQTFTTVAFTEASILGVGFLLFGRFLLKDQRAVVLIILSICLSSIVSISSHRLSLEFSRAIFLSVFFYFIGTRLKLKSLSLIIEIMSIIVLMFVTVEVLDLERYVSIFEPNKFYVATRGFEDRAYDQTGVFLGAIGFEGRFSFGLTNHRTASVFIEQVSLANFSSVLGMYLICFFDQMSLRSKLISSLTAFCIIVTNDARTSSAFLVFCLIGYIPFGKLSRQVSLMVLPAALLLGAMIYLGADQTGSDDLQGRVAGTISTIRTLQFSDYFGFGAQRASEMMDSGYPYLVAVGTLAGLVIFWLWLNFCIAGSLPRSRRCRFALNAFFAANLMIGGTSTITIKIAAPLWLIIGGVRRFEIAQAVGRRGVS